MFRAKISYCDWDTIKIWQPFSLTWWRQARRSVGWRPSSLASLSSLSLLSCMSDTTITQMFPAAETATATAAAKNLVLGLARRATNDFHAGTDTDSGSPSPAYY